MADKAQEELAAAQQALQQALQNTTGAPARDPYDPDAPLKVRVQVTLDEVSLRLTCNSKTLDKKLVDACVVPFLGAYNQRVETHKQVELDDLISIKINEDLLGREDIEAEARYILARASARAVDNGSSADGYENADLQMVLGTRETHEREWHEKGRPVQGESSMS